MNASEVSELQFLRRAMKRDRPSRVIDTTQERETIAIHDGLKAAQEIVGVCRSGCELGPSLAELRLNPLDERCMQLADPALTEAEGLTNFFHR